MLVADDWIASQNSEGLRLISLWEIGLFESMVGRLNSLWVVVCVIILFPS